jgi:hypothetical protein
MSQSRYRALRVVLGFLSLVLAIGGMFMILSNKPLIMRMFMHPPESESLPCFWLRSRRWEPSPSWLA